MKKSIIGLPVAAAILLAMAGCAQEADSGSSGGGGGGTPLPALVSDLSTIAAAFDDGSDTVRIGTNLYLGGGELVIPAGKTLDLRTNNVDLAGLTENSKIIAEGDIILNSSQSVRNGINWSTLGAGAKIIASEDFIKKYVNVDYAEIKDEIDPNWPQLTADGGNGIIKADWDQIVLIQELSDLRDKWDGESDVPPDPNTDKKGFIFGYDKDYLALRTPVDGVRGPEAEALKTKASGIKMYLTAPAGKPVIIDVATSGSGNPEIDLSGPKNDAYYKEWPPRKTPEPPVPPESLRNYNGDTNGSLTVAGTADMKNGTIKSPGGFNIWGVLKNTGSQQDTLSVTDAGIPFIGYTVRLHGVTFGGNAEIKGSVRNSFGASATFNGNLSLTGPATFNGATFSGNARFSGPVIFVAEGTSDSKSVDFNGESVMFGDDVTFQGPITSSTTIKCYGRVETNDLSVLKNIQVEGAGVLEISLKEVDADNISDKGNIKFLNDVIITGEEVNFDGNVTFVKNVTFDDDTRVTFAGSESLVSIGGAATFGSKAAFTSNVFSFETEGKSTFKDFAYFGDENGAGSMSLISFGDTVTFGTYAQLYSDVVLAEGDVIFEDIGTFSKTDVTIKGNLAMNAMAKNAITTNFNDITVAKTATFGTLATITPTGNVNFASAVFKGPLNLLPASKKIVTIGEASFMMGGSLLETMIIEKALTVAAGADINYSGKLIFGNKAVVLLTDAAKVGTIANTIIEVSDDTVKANNLVLDGNTSVTIDSAKTLEAQSFILQGAGGSNAFTLSS
ncbi:MAG: hypothetical protein LBH18_01045, partial [Spirochaetaceae bacterium]|nr:hypothetical protein [Spirochaetaceae bacterium]